MLTQSNGYEQHQTITVLRDCFVSGFTSKLCLTMAPSSYRKSSLCLLWQSTSQFQSAMGPLNDRCGLSNKGCGLALEVGFLLNGHCRHFCIYPYGLNDNVRGGNISKLIDKDKHVIYIPFRRFHCVYWGALSQKFTFLQS